MLYNGTTQISHSQRSCVRFLQRPYITPCLLSLTHMMRSNMVTTCANKKAAEAPLLVVPCSMIIVIMPCVRTGHHATCEQVIMPCAIMPHAMCE